jgi:hypothetical protein
VASGRNIHRKVVVESRDGLQRLVEAIRRGELTAAPGYVARLEGAIAALDALIWEAEPPATRRS